MRSRLITDHCLRIAAIGFLSLALGACSSGASALHQQLYAFRLSPPSLVELSRQDRVVRQYPIAIPAGCGLHALYPAPRGAYLAIELSCAFGQAVVWVNTDTGDIKQAYTEADSHFLAWTPDGRAVYLRVDTINNPQVLRASISSGQDLVAIPANTYDLAPQPDGSDFLYSFSRGMGYGSETWLAHNDGSDVKQILSDSMNYLSLLRWSPDGNRIAYIKIPDSATPYTVGELWVAGADGSDARFLARADAGHGFAPAWSPDGTQIAFVVRDNPNDPEADQSPDALVSHIALVNVETGQSTSLTNFPGARVDAPAWSPDGASLTFTAVLNGRMQVQSADPASGKTHVVLAESACCSAWLRK